MQDDSTPKHYTCNKCHETKTESEFSRASNKRGRYYYCRECGKVVSKAWRERNPVSTARYRREQTERLKITGIPEHWDTGKYHREHPLEAREVKRRHRIRRGVESGLYPEITIEPVSYERVIEVHGMVCHICGGPIKSEAELHFDHVKAVSLGGSHTFDNIKPAHMRCNIIKKNKEWRQAA